MTAPLIKDVSDTAFMVAFYRAIESERPDALFHDPLARVLAGAHGQKIADQLPRIFPVGWMVVIRTCIIDDLIQSAIKQGVDAVLNLGAGLDTRPYRMALPDSLPWIEVDFSHMIELKERRLTDQKPNCRLERVKLDLSDISERRKFFWELNSRFQKVLVLTEGVVPYLSVEETASLADDLKSQPCFQKWIVDYFSPEILKYRKQHPIQRRMKNAPFRFAPKDYFGLFSEHGWRTQEIRYIADEAERLNRPIPLPRPLKALFALRRLFTPVHRRDRYRKFTGYVLFEPFTGLP